jgi:hypothetical protein
MEDGKLTRKIPLYSFQKLLELTKFIFFPTSRLPLTSKMKVRNSHNSKKTKKEKTNITEMFPRSLSVSPRMDLKRLF